MGRIKRIVLLSMITLCFSVMMIVGGTFALFSDSQVVNNHLEAGNLDVGLHRVSYIAHQLDKDGVMKTSIEDTSDVDLNQNASKLFEVKNAVPTSYYQATLRISNNGSTAFNYGLRILWEKTDKTSALEESFAKQIEITVTSSKLNSPKVFRLADCVSNDVGLGYILKDGSAETVTVKATFVNDNNVNNDAMLATIDFDVQIYAAQKVD